MASSVKFTPCPCLCPGGCISALPPCSTRAIETLPNLTRWICELFYATEPDKFDAVASGQPFIRRGEGSYPTGAYDCGCIYASAPVDAGDRLWFYYMGGNGRHTDYRETSLARGWLRKDRFACYEPKKDGSPAVLTTAQLLLGEGPVTLTADIAAGGYVRACTRWAET